MHSLSWERQGKYIDRVMGCYMPCNNNTQIHPCALCAQKGNHFLPQKRPSFVMHWLHSVAFEPPSPTTPVCMPPLGM